MGGIGVKRHPTRPAKRGKRGKRLQRPRLVVRGHHGHQCGFRTQNCCQRLRLHKSLSIDRQFGYAKVWALCEGAGSFQHGGMLDCRDHEVQRFFRFGKLPEDRVVALAAAAGEAQTLGRDPGGIGEAMAGVLQHSPGFASGVMRAGRVALTTRGHRLHCLPDFREQRRSRVVVKINQSVLRHHFA